MPKKQFNAEFALGTRVSVDGAGGGIVTAVQFRRATVLPSSCYAQYEVCWFANGDSKVFWFDEWRLEEEK